MGANFPRYVGRDWPRNRDGYNWGAGINPRALELLRRRFWPSRLNAETRVWTLAPWCWDAAFGLRALTLRRGFGPSRLGAETRLILTLRLGILLFNGLIFRQPTHETYGIYMRAFLFELSPQHISFVWLEVEKIKHSVKVRSFRYYPNSIFAYACMNCSFGITQIMYI